MIAHVRGKVIVKSLESVVVEANGVGYEAFIPLSTYYKLPDTGSDIALYIHTHLKDDAIQLFGFLTKEEKEVFQLLITVTGIGPKLARNILSGIAPEDLVSSISRGDKGRLGTIPGIGAKTAERLILELKDKVRGLLSSLGPAMSVATAERDSKTIDVVSALSNLGYKSVQAEDAVKKARESISKDGRFEDLLKETLKILSKR